MRRGFGFQQQCHADDGMWMETQAQQQSYGAFHEESWGSDNSHHHKQFPGMHMKPGGFHVESELSMSKHQGGKLGGNHVTFQENKPSGHGYGYMHGANKKFPFGGTNTSHQFSNGGAKFNNGGGRHGYFAEDSEFEAYIEEHHGGATMKMDEMRHEYHNNNWGGDGFYANTCDMNKMNMKRKPHGGYKVEWTAKGV